MRRHGGRARVDQPVVSDHKFGGAHSILQLTITVTYILRVL
jgi:hypothetical protein